MNVHDTFQPSVAEAAGPSDRSDRSDRSAGQDVDSAQGQQAPATLSDFYADMKEVDRYVLSAALLTVRPDSVDRAPPILSTVRPD